MLYKINKARTNIKYEILKVKYDTSIISYEHQVEWFYYFRVHLSTKLVQPPTSQPPQNTIRIL